MSQVKDYMKVIITALLSVLTTMLVTGVFTQNAKVNESATKSELDNGILTVKKEAFKYTDDKIETHEKTDIVRYSALNKSLSETKDMVRFLYENEIKKINK